MAKDFKVKARFVADDKASPQIAKVEGRFKRLTTTVKSSALAQVAALGGVVVALRALVRFTGSSIEKANQQEVAVNQLNAALSSLGPTADSVSQSLQEQASALQKVTTFGDETIIEVQTMIASFVKEEEAIKKSTAATLDFATAFGIDLKAASALVSKSLGSSTNALTRYGIEVEGAVGSSERLNSMIENIAKVAGGRAEAAVNTFAGAWKQLSNALGDVQEQIAGVGTKNQGVIDAIKSTTRAIQSGGEAWLKYGENIKTALSYTPIGLWLRGISLIAEKTTDLAHSLDAVEVSEAALEATAGRLGITVEELRKRLEAAKNTIGPVNQELGKLTEKQKQAATAAKTHAEEEKRLKEELTATEEAFAKLGSALGEITSLELQKEILAIEDSLQKMRDAGEANTEEFLRLERLAGAKIDSLKARIDSLRDGAGDLAAVVREKAGPAFEGYTKHLEGASNELERQRGLTQGLTEDQKRLSEEIARAPASSRQVASVGGTRFAPARSPELRSPADYSLSRFGTGGTFTTTRRVRTDSRGNIIPS